MAHFSVRLAVLNGNIIEQVPKGMQEGGIEIPAPLLLNKLTGYKINVTYSEGQSILLLWFKLLMSLCVFYEETAFK